VWLSPGRVRYRVSVLVLTVFAGPRPPGQVARHLNDNSLDDRLSNLAWGTHAENVADAIRNGCRADPMVGEDNPRAKLTEADVLAIRGAVANGAVQQQLAASYGVSKSLIHNIIKRKTWRHI
jgi:hypothetical protein